MQQMTIKDIEIAELQARVKAFSEEFEQICRISARSVNRHDLSSTVDKAYSYVSDILNVNDGKNFPLYLLVAVCIMNPDVAREMILGFLSEITGSEVPRKKRMLTAEEELRIIKRKIKEHGLEPIFEGEG